MAIISIMAWRIGGILDINRQFDWIEENGFEAVSFHASAGFPGKWQGISLIGLDDSKIAFLRKRLEVFKRIEIHAPFEYELRQPDKGLFNQLVRICQAGVKLGASVITVHSQQPGYDEINKRIIWKNQIETLSSLLNGTDTQIGLELTSGFEILDEISSCNVGITLDVGHMFLRDEKGSRPIDRYGSMNSVIHLLGNRLVHLHIHDYDSRFDHIELGTGVIDFKEIFLALKNIKYNGIFCLELNPERVTPDGILRSAEFIREGMK